MLRRFVVITLSTKQMHCPICNTPDTKVVDSRILQDGSAVRRRRKCEQCDRRFTTYEKLEIQMPSISKHDGRLENYNRDKIQTGIKKACHKRSVSMEQIDRIVELLEKFMLENFDKVVPANKIGEFVMDRLLILDPVSYVRFASFYWNFEDIDDFVKALQLKRTEE